MIMTEWHALELLSMAEVVLPPFGYFVARLEGGRQVSSRIEMALFRRSGRQEFSGRINGSLMKHFGLSGKALEIKEILRDQ